MEVAEVINRASILLRAGVAWLYYRAGGNATRFRTAYFGDPPALELLSIEDAEASVCRVTANTMQETHTKG